jgi:hypothetical protein
MPVETINFSIQDALESKVSSKGYFDTKILEAIEKEDFDDVEMYQGLANFLHISLEKDTLLKIEENSTFLAKSIRNTKYFSSGFISGKGENAASIAGSIASDMTVVGDLRDLSTEGKKLIEGKEYDKFVLGVATVGVGLSLSQVLTSGTSTPMKVGASIVKISKKTKKLSKPFLALLSTKMSKVIDVKKLKKLDFNSFPKLKKSFSSISKSLKLNHISKIFKNVNKIKKNTSIPDTISIIKYVDNEKELGKVVKISSTYRHNTKAVMKILGKGAFRGATKVAKYTTLFIGKLISLAVSAFLFIVGLYFQIRFWRKRFRTIAI